MDSQVRVLELENSLEKERVRLASLRKQHYHLAGASAGWQWTPPLPLHCGVCPVVFAKSIERHINYELCIESTLRPFNLFSTNYERIYKCINELSRI